MRSRFKPGWHLAKKYPHAAGIWGRGFYVWVDDEIAEVQDIQSDVCADMVQLYLVEVKERSIVPDMLAGKELLRKTWRADPNDDEVPL